MAGERDDDAPVSSYPSSGIDEIMSSLLVPFNGQLVPASSLPSSQGVDDARSTPASAHARRSSRSSARETVPRVKDLRTPRSQAGTPQAGEYQAVPSALYRKDGGFYTTSASRHPGSAEAALQSKLGTSQQGRARLSSQEIPAEQTRTSLQAYGKADGNAYGIENIPPPSGQTTDRRYSANFAHSTRNMENMQFNQQDFGFQSDHKMDLMSIEDWEKANPYTPPPAKVIPARLDRNKGKDTQIFNTECQRRGLTHEFRFEEVAKGCFDVTLFVEGNQIDKAGPYASHRDAKEAMCRLALGKLSAMGFKNLTDSSGAGKKRKSSELSTTSPLAPDGLDDENWVAIINEYAQQNKMDYPDYEFTEDPPHSFRCTMGFADSPLQAFGLAYGPFPKKDTAKKAAAMEAVKWLRAEGKLSQTEAMLSRRRKSSTRQSLPGAIHNDHSNPYPTAMDTADSITTPDKPPTESAAQQVFELARALGFSQPKFDSVKNGGNFVDESATFMDKDVRYEPRLAGVHGQVRRVFGKKAAHEECCRLVLWVLKEIRQSRLGNAV